MKSKKVIAALCALAVVVSSSGGLPLGGARLFETALTANADVTDVFKAVSDPDAIYGPTKIINGNFESGMNNNNRNGNYQGTNSGWGTTDNAFEISSSISTYGLKNATGYFAEMNANNAATLYQDLTTTGGDIMVWKLDHAARRSQKNGIPNSNSMAVMIGASDGNYPSGTNSNINVHISSDTLATFEAGGVTNPEGRTLGYFASEEDSKYLTIDSKDSNNEWYSARGVYIIPDGQTTTRFAFVSTIADYDLRGWGNMLDNITFATLLGNASATQLASGDVELTGYWGDSDASKTLKIKIGDTEYSADMTDVLNNNFKIVIPLAALGGADTVTLYHVDYPEAGRTIPVTPARHVTYDGNGNTGGTVPTDEKDYPSSASASVLGNAGNLEKSGHIFNGWNTEPDGSGTQYSEGDTFKISDNTTLYAQWVPKPLVHYQLWITGNEVTSENLSGDGWSYDAETNTLTLNNYSFTGVGTNRVTNRTIDPTVIFYDPQNGATFNIVLEGENNIVSESKNGGTAWGIYSRSDFTISGSGTLNVSTADGARRASAIYSEKNLEIKSGTLNASSGTVTAGPQGSGIEGPDSMVVTIGEDAVVTASGYNAAIKANVRNAIEGTGWNDKDGTDGKTNIDVSASGQNIGGFKRVQFPAVPNDPTYTVTIPADVNVADDGTASADVSAEYDIGESTLSVTVASENGYKMKADYNSSILIPYKVTYGGKDLSDATEVLSVTGEGSSSETLYFSVDPEDMYAGKYSDVLTFNISLS